MQSRSSIFFSDEVSKIQSSKLYSTGQDEIDLAQKEGQSLLSEANYLTSACASLKRVLTKILDEQKENTISIKLPQPKDLDDIVKDMASLQKAISQIIVNDIIDGAVIVDGWESGSYWINIFVKSTAAISLIASVGWSSAVVFKKYQEGRLIEKYVNALEIKNESLDDLRKGQQAAIAQLIHNEARAIQVSHYNEEDDNERFERIKMAIKIFSDLIERGAEVHPALNSPESVQNLFPDFAKIDHIQSKTKLLAQKTQKSEP